jgi:hypothetical protein
LHRLDRRRRGRWSRRSSRLGFRNGRLLFDFRFNFGFGFRFDAPRLRFSHHGFRFNLRHFDGDEVVFCYRPLSSVGSRHSKFPAEPVRETILDRVRMRCHRHAHVLQFTNDLSIVAIQLAGQLVNSKLWHSLFKNS